MAVHFDPNNNHVKQLFKELGIPKEHTDDGVLRSDELGLKEQRLLSIATSGPSTPNDEKVGPKNEYLSYEEAKTALRANKKSNGDVSRVWKWKSDEFNDQCTILSVAHILRNVLNPNNRDHYLGNTTFATCVNQRFPYSKSYDRTAFKGIYFVETMAPETITEFGKKYVVKIAAANSKGKWSGVIIGDGKVLTTNSALVNEDSKTFHRTFTVVAHGRTIECSMLSIRAINQRRNYAVIEVPALRDHAGAKLAMLPPKPGDQVWSIGHVYSRIMVSGDHFPRVYSTGTVESVQENEIVFDVSGASGYSGGPVLNVNGELVGINSDFFEAAHSGSAMATKTPVLRQLFSASDYQWNQFMKSLRNNEADK